MVFDGILSNCNMRLQDCRVARGGLAAVLEFACPRRLQRLIACDSRNAINATGEPSGCRVQPDSAGCARPPQSRPARETAPSGRTQPKMNAPLSTSPGRPGQPLRAQLTPRTCCSSRRKCPPACTICTTDTRPARGPSSRPGRTVRDTPNLSLLQRWKSSGRVV